MLQRAWPKRNDIPPSTARLQASTAGLSEQDQCAERRLPTTFLRLQHPQLDDTRASSMIAAADTQNKAKVGCLSRTLGGVKLGGIIEESHTAPITFNEASGRR